MCTPTNGRVALWLQAHIAPIQAAQVPRRERVSILSP
jgi:hypothetical protein